MLIENEAREEIPEAAGPGLDGDWAELLEPRYLVSVVMLCLGVALFAFNEFFVSTAMPSAVKMLGQPSLLAWAFTCYLVFAIIGGAVAAYMKERFGSRGTLVIATAVFVVGTVSACLARHWSFLIAGRLLQGLGEGTTIALCYALIPELFPKRLVQKVFGVEAIAWAAAAFGGPLIAGLLTEYVSWRAAFASSLPAAAIFVALVLIMVPESRRSGSAPAYPPLFRLSLVGAGILMISVSSVMTSTLSTFLLLVAAIVLLGLFVGVDRRSADSILPAAAFSVSRLPGSGFWVIMLMPFASSTGAVYLVYGLQVIWGLNPTEAGISGAVMALSWSFSGILIATVKLADARQKLIFIGPVLLVAGIAANAAALVADQYWLIYPAQAIVGAGFGFSWGILNQVLTDRAPEGERDKTAACVPTLQSAGYALGGAVFGLIASLAGLREGPAPEAARGVLLPVFLAGLGVAVLAAILGAGTARLSSRRLPADPGR